MYSHVRDLGPIPMSLAPSPHFDYLRISLHQTVQEFDTLQLYRHVADMWWKPVQPHERPGTHPNESSTIKYPQFDYLHNSLAQIVQELELDPV